MAQRDATGATRVRLHGADAIAEASSAFFGRVLLQSEWVTAAGAPPGAHVDVSVEVAPDRGPDVVVRVLHPYLVGSMERRVRRAADGVVVRNVHFHVHEAAPAGVGTAAFARQVDALRRLGVRRIEAEIAGSAASPYNGYYTWARMGFNAPVTAGEQRRLPAHLSGARTLHELLTAPGGREWWRRYGTGREAVFESGSLESPQCDTQRIPRGAGGPKWLHATRNAAGTSPKRVRLS